MQKSNKKCFLFKTSKIASSGHAAQNPVVSEILMLGGRI